MYEPFYEFIQQLLPEFKIDLTIVEHWGQGDAIALMQQLGVLPAIKPH